MSGFDANSFLNRVDALGVFAQSCRDTLFSDSYVGGRATFDAVVLSDPLPLSTANASIYFGSAPSPPSLASISGVQGLLRKAQATLTGTKTATAASQLGDTSNKFVFKGRVEAVAGRPSQHCWYPDPCAVDFADTAEYANKIIGLHTTFISLDDHSNNSTLKLPRAGDKVVVELMMIPGSSPPQYDTTFGYYKGILSDASTDGTQIAGATNCQRIAGLFGGATGTFGGYASGSTPAPPASDTGQIPVVGRFSSPYGPRNVKTKGGTSKYHIGIDIARNVGKGVRPVKAGKVIKSYKSTGGGNTIIIQHPDGDVSKYKHLMDGSRVAVGTELTTSDFLGAVGNTGTWTTGAHLHFEFWPQGKKHVDPIIYFGWQPYLTEGGKWSAKGTGNWWFGPAGASGEPTPVAQQDCPDGKEWWVAGEYTDGRKYAAGCYDYTADTEFDLG
jgi:murein DD-endopeptidase MepM/ murein hydrolase activator NlpD